MFDHKIVFTGPVGVGKTTAIATYSEIEPVTTEVSASESEVKSIKDTTTVAMDYGFILLDEETKVHLYGTPGQVRFEFMWDILSKGSHGLVILIDNSVDDPLAQLDFYLTKFGALVDTVPVVIGINKMELPHSHNLTIDDYKAEVEKKGYSFKVFPVDVRKEEDVRLLIMTLLFSIPPVITKKL